VGVTERTLLDDGLDGLVHMVVNVLASNDWGNDTLGLALNMLSLVTELSLLGREPLLHLVGIVVLEAAVLDGDDVVVVLLGEDLTVLYGLYRGVVVVLVNLLVNGGDDLLTLLTLDGLVLDSWSNFLVNSGVVVTRLAHEVLDGGFGGVHFECGFCWLIWCWFECWLVMRIGCVGLKS
jgi:hypothetical protein